MIIVRSGFTLFTEARMDPLYDNEEEQLELTAREEWAIYAVNGFALAITVLGLFAAIHFRHEIWALVKGWLA